MGNPSTSGVHDAALRAGAQQLAALRGERRDTFLFIAGILVAFLWLDALIVGGVPWMSGLSRLVIAAVCGASALAVGRADAARIGRLTLLVAVAVGLGWGGMVHGTGGPESPLRPWTHALVLALVLLAPESPRTVAIAGSVALASVLASMVLGGASAKLAVVYLAAGVAAVAIASYGSERYRRLRRAELQAERERAEAVEELARSERGRARTERLALVGRLAAGVAHEINNPLAFVTANLGWLRTELRAETKPTPEELDELLEETTAGVHRIRQIVQDLRAFSREDGDDVQPQPVDEAIEEAVRLASVRLRGLARVELAVPPGLAPVLANRQRLVQVLVNLLVNAADALEERPPAGRGVVRVEAAAAGPRLQLTVSDNGPGIPGEVLGRIFEPFVTTKPPGKGTGLGLAVSREYVQRGGGTLEAANLPGGGACFTVQLPLAA